MNTPELSATERLALSRERLRVALAQIDVQSGPGTGASTHVAGLLGLLKTTLPGASILIDALGHWWAHSASQSPARAAADIADDFLKPIAKSHPLALVLGALALGGLVVLIKPWRWALKPKLLATWGPSFVSGVLASGTLQAWILANLAKSAQAPQGETKKDGV